MESGLSTRGAVRNDSEPHPMSLEKSKPWSRAAAHTGEGCQDRAKANPARAGEAATTIGPAATPGRPKGAIAGALRRGRHEVIDADLSDYFGTIPHAGLLRLVARRVSDGSILGLVKRFLKAPIVEETDGKRRTTPKDWGQPQGGVISPLLANLYLNSLDHGVNSRPELDPQFVRYTDDFVLLCRPGCGPALYERLQVYLAAKGLTLNAAKTRVVDVRAGASCRFPGCAVSWRKSDGSGR